MLTQAVPLALSFKGNRNYITGADIAQAMLNLTGSCSQLRIEFHHMAACALSMQEVSADQLPAMKQLDDVYAWLACTDSSGSQRFWLARGQETSTHLVRLEYDESVFTRHAMIDDTGIHADAASMLTSPIDALVALNKHMLNQCVEVHPWIFVRLDMQHWPLDLQHVFLKRPAKALHGLYKTQIVCNGTASGAIYFTRRPTP